MSVVNPLTFKQYDCDGSQVDFPIVVDYQGDEDNIKVTLFDETLETEGALVLGTHYTIASDNVTTIATYSSNYKITISLKVPYTQPEDITTNSIYDPETLEGMYDRAVLMCRQLSETIDRTIKLAQTDAGNTMILPALSTGLDKYVYVNSSGGIDYKEGSAAFPASDLGIVDAGDYYTEDEVEGALQEVGAKQALQDTALAAQIALLETISDPVGGLKSFATYKDRSAKGLLPIAFNNKVATTGTYADLYAEIADIFEKAHTDAGDAASGAGFFYPTPPPGYGTRFGVPDTAVIDATADIDDSTELITLATADYNQLKVFKSVSGDGVPVRLKLVSGALPGGIADEETTYYIRFKTTPDIELYDTEANAIDTSGTTGRIDLTDAVGTFKLSQEGIVYNDAGQGWQLGGDNDETGARDVFAKLRNRGFVESSNAGGDFTDMQQNINYQGLAEMAKAMNNGLDGDIRSTNETHGREQIMFGYIKAFYILGV